ncbi:MAG: hypothetical protein HQL45_13550 [Alphaproteobacteria bacterium]|nr:hypothetical protein [Alphaproteobacteria bacterium]
MRKNRHPPARPSKGETATFKEFCLVPTTPSNLEQGSDRQTHAVDESDSGNLTTSITVRLSMAEKKALQEFAALNDEKSLGETFRQILRAVTQDKEFLFLIECLRLIRHELKRLNIRLREAVETIIASEFHSILEQIEKLLRALELLIGLPDENIEPQHRGNT